METGRVALSVVVPTFERRPSLARLLDALERQDIALPFEVIVVDDGSSDGTAVWLRARPRAAYSLRVLEQAHAGPAAARNLGVAQARGELIVFLDDDVVPEAGLLAAHVAAHEAAPNSVVCGTMLPPDGWDRPTWIRWEEQKLVAQYRAMRDGVYSCTYRQFFTGNASLARERFAAAGGFDVTFARAEDVDLGFRLDRLGMHFVFEPLARTYHYPQRTFAAWQRTPYRYGQADVVMHREKNNPILGSVFREFHGRHWLNRAVARLCVGSAIFFGPTRLVLASTARASGWIGLDAVGSMILSALFNLLYWQGVSDALGGPTRVWRAVAERRPGRTRESYP
jgi:GT2 family glycosyltransferase